GSRRRHSAYHLVLAWTEDHWTSETPPDRRVGQGGGAKVSSEQSRDAHNGRAHRPFIDSRSGDTLDRYPERLHHYHRLRHRLARRRRVFRRLPESREEKTERAHRGI